MSLILDGTNGLSDVDGTAAAPAIRGTDSNTGIFFPAADTIAFAEGGAEVMRIDSSGRVGIGTTSPTGFLNVDGTGGDALPATSGSTQSAGLITRLQQGGGIGSVMDIGGNGGTGSWIQVTEASNLATNYNLLLNPNGGNLLVGTTSALQSSKLSVLGTGNIADFRTSSSGGYPVVCENTAAGSTSMVVFLSGASFTTVGSITYNGSLTLYNTTSDQRLKENIQDADSASSLIDLLKVRKFDWTQSNVHQRYGFIAQELVTVVPEAVHQPEDSEAMMAVDYSKLVPMLVKEIQSLRQRITALEAA